MDDRCDGDPFVAGRCPKCGTLNSETKFEGIGQTAVRCAHCGADAAPFRMSHGYTIAFDAKRSVGVTLPGRAAETIARDAKRQAAIPANSIQNSVPNVVYSCGALIHNDYVYLPYAMSDTATGFATVELHPLLEKLLG